MQSTVQVVCSHTYECGLAALLGALGAWVKDIYQPHAGPECQGCRKKLN